MALYYIDYTRNAVKVKFTILALYVSPILQPIINIYSKPQIYEYIARAHEMSS